MMTVKKALGNNIYRIFLLLLVYATLNSVSATLVSFIARDIINNIIQLKGAFIKTTLLFTCGYLILIPLVPFVKYHAQKRIFRVLANIKKAIYTHAIHIDLNAKYVSSVNPVAMLNQDIISINSFWGEKVVDIFESALMLLVMSAISICIDWRIFVFVMACSACYSFVILFTKRIQAYDDALKEHFSELNDLCAQLYRGFAIIHLFTGTALFIRQLTDHTGSIKLISIKKARLNTLYCCLAWGSNMIREIGIIVICPLVLGLDLGTTMALINISSYLNGTLVSFGEGLIAYKEAQVSTARINQTLATPEEKHENAVAVLAPALEANINIDQITFSYQLGNAVLDNVTLHIRHGEAIGIVGDIGSGKSTFVLILLGLYAPQEGQVSLNGIPVDHANLQLLRVNISYVDQNATIFEATLRDNLTCFTPKIPDDEIVIALKEAMLSDWYQSLSDGLDTYLGHGGLSVSGGERQRICFARALLKNSPAIIFDEPTASLDKSNEQAITEAIRRQIGKRTIVVISHHWDTLCHMDRIIQFRNGKAVALPEESII